MLAKLLDDRRLVMLQADWTRSDPRISAFLASHQRFGIPFNIIYGPSAPNGIVLGELLGARMIEQGANRCWHVALTPFSALYHGLHQALRQYTPLKALIYIFKNLVKKAI